MGKILVVGSNKGGGGKSTTSANIGVGLAKKGHNVCLIDADKQRSLDKWQGYRKESEVEPFIFCMTKLGKISKELEAIRDNHDFIIVDVQGSNSVELIHALAVADLCIAPHQATQLDLDTIEELQTQVERILPSNPKLKVLAYQTLAHTNPATFEADRADFTTMVDELEDINLAESVGFYRVGYRSHWPEGRSVFDIPSNKGQKEITNLIDEVLSWLDQK